MSGHTPHKRRGVQGLIALALALSLLSLGGVVVWRDARIGQAPDVSGPVVEGWPEQASAAARIQIETAGENFVMEKRGAAWVMASRGDYPVRAERIAELDAMLQGLSFTEAMTRDADKFDRLGLGDPQAGGAGVRISVSDAEGGLIADLITGRLRSSSGVYVRRPGGVRAYAASGPVIDPALLGDPGRWMGLEFWNHEASAIARAEIQPEFGPSWRVMRAGEAQRYYELREPTGWRLVTAGAANGVATAGAQLRFRDVKPDQELVGAYVSRHAAVTFSGLAYEMLFFAEGDERWVTIELAALADDAAPRADHFNAQVEGWAFLVSEDAYERLTRGLGQVAEPTN
ncbi:MAG: DUF4340 domain-containing protein [Oceanicaulis sp.]|jgi:hypothetical protein|nr:DUF4340 domain-containing protein [Oceanicaulis sp.]